MDIVEIEREFTEFLAGKLNLPVDRQIFRGGIPAGKMGVGVLFDSEVKEKLFAPRQWNVQVLASFRERDEAMRFVAKVTGLFPCYDIRCKSCTINLRQRQANHLPLRNRQAAHSKTCYRESAGT